MTCCLPAQCPNHCAPEPHIAAVLVENWLMLTYKCLFYAQAYVIQVILYKKNKLLEIYKELACLPALHCKQPPPIKVKSAPFQTCSLGHLMLLSSFQSGGSG